MKNDKTSFKYSGFSGLDLWRIDLKIDKVHWFIRMYQCIKFDVCQEKGSQDIPVVSIFQCPVWPLDLKIERVCLLIRIIQCTKFDVHQAKKSVSQYFLMSNLILDPLTSKPVGIIYSLSWTSVQSLMSIKQRVLKILLGRYSYAWFDPWPFDLKIHGIHVLFRMYQCKKFEVCQAKGYQDIELSVYSYVQLTLELLT
jgi:hypothetical protein